MQHYPLFVRLQDEPCLVIGAGEVAARKLGSLLSSGATFTVIAPSVCAAMQTLIDNGAVRHLAVAFDPNDPAHQAELSQSRLVIAASGNRELDRAVAGLARRAGTLVNLGNQPDAGDVLLPSIVDRDPIIVAIGTGGRSPVLSRLLKARIEAFLPRSLSSLATLTGEYRDRIKARFATVHERRRFWETVLASPIASFSLAERPNAARDVLEKALAAEPGSASDAELAIHQGEVYLVGAGPGDPDLLTFRALRLIQQADVVLHDRLVSEPILALCRHDAERIHVGKRRAHHTLPQPDINRELVRHAREGKRVLRLKGGDPFIFGRGGEEIETLAAHGIPFQVVPGITAASGCASYAGIPLTHRDHAQSCVFVTGHVKDGELELPWNHLAQPRQTIVCYMGLEGLPLICQQLIEHGMARDTPAALIEQGTTSQQRVHVGTLSTLPDIVVDEQVRAPTLIIIGGVVTLREKLAWLN